MSEIVRPDLANADGAEVTQHLLDRGWKATIQTHLEDDGLHVRATGVAAETLIAALSDFVPTAPRGEWQPPDPAEIRDHVNHILALARATDTQLATLDPIVFRHAVRDLARAFVLTVRADWDGR
jgi:hypothetical protein